MNTKKNKYQYSKQKSNSIDKINIDIANAADVDITMLQSEIGNHISHEIHGLQHFHLVFDISAATDQPQVLKDSGFRYLTGTRLVPDQDLHRSCEFWGGVSEVKKSTHTSDKSRDQYDRPELKVIPEKTAEPDRLLFLYRRRGLSGGDRIC